MPPTPRFARLVRALVVAAAGAGLAAPATGAYAHEPGDSVSVKVGPHRPGAALLLTIHRGERPSSQVLARVWLTCGPAGGTHPHAEAACAALQRVHGPVRDPPAPRQA